MSDTVFPNFHAVTHLSVPSLDRHFLLYQFCARCERDVETLRFSVEVERCWSQLPLLFAFFLLVVFVFFLHFQISMLSMLSVNLAWTWTGPFFPLHWPMPGRCRFHLKCGARCFKMRFLSTWLDCSHEMDAAGLLVGVNRCRTAYPLPCRRRHEKPGRKGPKSFPIESMPFKQSQPCRWAQHYVLWEHFFSIILWK